MNAILADVFALYLKTKTFHWHMSGPHFRDCHLLLDEHANQLQAMKDPIAERIRKIWGTTLRSIGQIARLQRVQDNDAQYVEPLDMLAELREDNKSTHGTFAQSAQRHRYSELNLETGSMKPSNARGFCLKRVGAEAADSPTSPLSAAYLSAQSVDVAAYGMRATRLVLNHYAARR